MIDIPDAIRYIQATHGIQGSAPLNARPVKAALECDAMCGVWWVKGAPESPDLGGTGGGCGASR